MTRYLYLPLILLLAGCNVDETITTQPTPDADFSTLIEYSPAPGQFINDTVLAGFDGENTPELARTYAEKRLKAGYYVSLGAWGGYLIAGFEIPVENDGGYNLLIEGNSFNNSSEPGIVWVMRDENGNKLPDDTWYELKGSEEANVIRGYEVTYFRPAADGDPVTWSDNRGGNGTVDRTKEHTQSYYPAWFTGESRTFSGTLLPKNVVQSGNLWTSTPFEWGYSDNYSTTGNSLFRISDAVDAEGKTIDLPSVDFVKIQSGVMDKGPLIGEISTDVCRIRNYNYHK